MKKFIIFLVVVAGLLFGGSLLMPEALEFERSITINKSPSRVFPLVNNLENWDTWTAWAEEDRHMRVILKGSSSGVGSIQEFESSDGKDKGTITITESLPPKFMRYTLEMEGMETTEGWFKLKQVKSTTTEVTWGFKAPTKDPVSKYMMQLYVKHLIIDDFDRGLELLKGELGGL